MSRAFGDEVASRVGVNTEPGKHFEICMMIYLSIEILELDLCKDDKFIVIASDGVWEFMQNDDIAEIVMPFYE